jgi:hypothetical protein
MSQNEEGLRLRGGGGVGSGGAGGIGGTGVFGLFGTVVQCKSDDNSWYCMLAKFVNVLIMLMIILFILSIVFNYVKGFSRKRFVGGVGNMGNSILGMIS